MFRTIMLRSTMLSSRAIPTITRIPLANPLFFSSTHIIRSSAGYGDDPTELADNAGTKTPASSPDPSPSGSSSKGTTDPETVTSTKKTAGGQTGLKAEDVVARKDKAVGQGADEETEQKVLGEDGAGKQGPPGEEKKIGEKPKKQ